MSTLWKSLLQVFYLITYCIIWRIGNGRRLKPGIDPWVGCCDAYVFTKNMRNSLHNHGFLFLFHIGDVIHTNHKHQLWLQAEVFGFIGNDKVLWDNDIKLLHECHIRLIDITYEIISSNNYEGGIYTLRPSYSVLHEEEDLPQPL